MTIVRNSAVKKVKKSHNLWFEQIMALIAALNLLLVIFDLTYVPFRDFWLNGQVRIGHIRSAYLETEGISLDLIPAAISRVITKYDDIKGITPHRTTEAYIDKITELEQQLLNNSIDSPEIEHILSELRDRSKKMIDNNPFAEAGKSGTLERIKNIMREHLPNADNSAKQAFREFWNADYLRDRSTEELAFINREIVPLLQTNYFRHWGENNSYINNFGLIDFPFGLIFALEFICRTWYISRTYTGVSWRDAMLWRWYDIFLFLPFWRWLRVIPTVIRLNAAKLINLASIQKQISQGIVAGIAEDITEVVVIRVIGQMQTSIRQGEITKFLTTSEDHSYIDLNDINETAELVKIFANTLVDRVLPEIQPEAEALLQYSIEKAIQQSSAYPGISLIPGGKNAVSNITQQLVTQTYQTFSTTLQAALEEDKKFEKLVESLIESIRQSFLSEIQEKQSLKNIENLLIDLLEEIKVNYVARLSEEDVEQILEETRNIRKISHT
ncbi:MAG: hypothetical protein QNJ55_36355 [Xenococcus sp. MO_188.B8]|nr:hypothetical protein [Xenococcus sp. MO_188.B8]